MSGDTRVEIARDYLAAVRKHKVTMLPPSILTRECAELRRQLGQVLDAFAKADERDDGTEPYCTTCREWVGMFHGLDGWHHFRGDPAPGGKRELYDAGHEGVIAWTVPPGRALSPGQMRTVLDALDVAAEYKRERVAGCPDCEVHPAGLCTTCEMRLEQADAYGRVAGEIGGGQ